MRLGLSRPFSREAAGSVSHIILEEDALSVPRSQAIRLNVEPETHGVSPEAMPHGGTRGDLTGG